MWDWLDFSDIGSRAASWFGDALSSLPQQLLSADFLLPAALGAGGLYLQSNALKKAQQRQNEAVEQARLDQSALQQPVTATVDRMAFERSTPEVEKETTGLQRVLASNLDDYIAKARESMPTSATTGRVSSDYTTGLKTQSAEEAERRARLNAAWANLAAPQQQQFAQGIRDTGHNTTIANANADANTLARNASLNIQKAGEPSSSQLMIGDLLSTGGNALAANALLRPKASTVPKASEALRNMWSAMGA